MKKFYLLALVIASAICVNAQTGLMIKSGEKGLYLEHTIAAKEGLYAIGRLYNVSPKHIAAYNKMDLNAGISIGQVLRIPLTDTNFTQKSAAGTPIYHTVGGSEGLLKISNDHKKVSIKNLKDWNKLSSDNINAGSNLIIGFLVSKEMTVQRASEMAKKPEPATSNPEVDTPVKEELVISDKPLPEGPKDPVKPEVVKNTPPVTIPEVKQPEPKKEEPKPAPVVITPVSTPATAPVTVAVKENVPPAAIEGNGYFKSSFEQQTKSKPPAKNSTVTSGIFKTTSGWVDEKYYLLIDNISPGTIVKIINPDNNKAVYAKVLGEMNGIRQNEGLDIRISSAAASALKVTENDKFIVKVNY